MGINFLDDMKRLFSIDVPSKNEAENFIEKARRDGRTKIDVFVKYGSVSLYKGAGVYKIGIYLERYDKKPLSLGETTTPLYGAERIKENVVKKAGYIRDSLVAMGLESEVVIGRYKNM